MLLLFYYYYEYVPFSSFYLTILPYKTVENGNLIIIIIIIIVIYLIITSLSAVFLMFKPQILITKSSYIHFSDLSIWGLGGGG